MPERICKVDGFPYAGKMHNAGDRFEVEDQHVQPFILIGKIEPDAPADADVEYTDTADDADREEINGTLHVKRKYTKRQAA